MPLVITSPLDLEWVPQTLVARENELQEIRDYVVNTPFSTENLWVSGKAGLGKTLTCKFLASQIERDHIGKTFYMICEKSIRNSIDKVRTHYHLPMSRRDISASTFASAVLEAFPSMKYFFIIDEPDKAYAKRDIANFIHSLWNYLIDEHCKFSFLFISKFDMAHARKIFPTDTLSRLQLKELPFSPYDAPEIVAILKQRLDYVVQSYKYDLPALFVLAKHIRKVGGDMRQALEILRESVRLAKGQIITTSIMEQAVEWGKRTWWTRRLRSLPPHWALITYLAASYCKEKEIVKVDEPTIIKLYNEAVRGYNIEPLGPSTVYWIIKQLSGSREEGEPFFEHKLEKLGLPAEIVFEKGERDRIANVGKSFDWPDMLTLGV
jgi:Cdc6-like AAA superfamily ATPase